MDKAVNPTKYVEAIQIAEVISQDEDGSVVRRADRGPRKLVRRVTFDRDKRVINFLHEDDTDFHMISNILRADERGTMLTLELTLTGEASSRALRDQLYLQDLAEDFDYTARSMTQKLDR